MFLKVILVFSIFQLIHARPQSACPGICQTYNPVISGSGTRFVDPCNPNPCGLNAQCRVQNSVAVCSCEPGFFGDPLQLKGCRPECETDSACPAHAACVKNKCVSSCSIATCGAGATCDVVNHLPICKCPPGYQGDPSSRCYPGNSGSAGGISESRVCVDGRCHGAGTTYPCDGVRCSGGTGGGGGAIRINPCEGACGINAECRVDSSSNKAICSCPRNWLGHPFESCRQPTPDDLCNPNPCGANARCQPGYDTLKRDRPVCTCLPGYVGDAIAGCQRGECQSDVECGSHRVCRNYLCINPCTGACGHDANCDVRNGAAVCSCPSGYNGDPFNQCIRVVAQRQQYPDNSCVVCH